MKPNEFVGILFLSRNVAHSVHLNTGSFSKHRALGEFYDKVIDLADKFAETYQGRYGLIGQILQPGIKESANIITFLQKQLDTIEKERYSVVNKNDTTLQNLIDEIVELYLRTLYKLKFLN